MGIIKKILPLLPSAVITFGVYYFCKNSCVTVNLSKFLEMSITVFSILLGFLFTITTILHSVKNEKMEFIRKSGGMDSLNLTLKTSIYFSFVVVFLTMFYFLIEEFFCKFDLIKYVLLFIHIAAATYCFKFIQVFFKIILK